MQALKVRLAGAVAHEPVERAVTIRIKGRSWKATVELIYNNIQPRKRRHSRSACQEQHRAMKAEEWVQNHLSKLNWL